MIVNILSIAGSDCSGGAGIQADIKAICANGGYAMSVTTAITAQNTQGVDAVELLRPEIVAAQLQSIFSDIRVDAVKTGMLGNADIIEAVADSLERYQPKKIVLDPIMVATSGDRLLTSDAVTTLQTRLLPLADLITPNLLEAADLLNVPVAEDRATMSTQAEAFEQSVYLKGGHLTDATTIAPDLLRHREQQHWLATPRLPTRNTHGTGCTLSASIATRWAITGDLLIACQQAKAYLQTALAAADELTVGRPNGHGPVHHFAK